MGYATKADLVPLRLSDQELAQLTNDAGGQSVDDDVVTAALDAASADVDSYCRQRYQVPLASSQKAKDLAISIALYKLFLRRRRVSDQIRQEYEDAISFLKDLASGKAALDQPTNAPAQIATGETLSTTMPEKFSDDNLDGF